MRLKKAVKVYIKHLEYRLEGIREELKDDTLSTEAFCTFGGAKDEVERTINNLACLLDRNTREEVRAFVRKI